MVWENRMGERLLNDKLIVYLNGDIKWSASLGVF